MARARPQTKLINDILLAVGAPRNAAMRKVVMDALMNPGNMSILGLQRVGTTPPKSNKGKVGDALKWLGTNVGGAALAGLGHGSTLAGGLTEAAGIAGEGVVNAAGQIPGAVSNVLTTQRQRDIYGGTPIDAISDIAKVVAPAAGSAVAGTAHAIGDVMRDIGDALKLSKTEAQLKRRSQHYGEMVKGMGLNDAELDVLARYISAYRRGMK